MISDENVGTSVSFDHWITCGRISLTKKDKQHILGGKELSDMHINAFQSIARRQFPHVGGLYNTLLLDRMLVTHDQGCEQSLQIIHIKDRAHWAALQFIQSEIFLYDSLFNSASPDTLKLIAKLAKTKKNFFMLT